MGEAVLTANPNNNTPPSCYTPVFFPKCWILRDSVAALVINPLLATCHVLGGRFLVLCGMIIKTSCVIVLVHQDHCL
ncbi:hypothetical protein PAMP_000547 [Pampus punctatissimus]